MKTKNTDVVAEYLREVDKHLAGLPVLQRRELLADLEAHIATERAERNLQSEGELIEVLERLGAPEVVAAAAHEEAGPRPAPPSRPPWYRSFWPVALAVAGVLAVVVLCFGFAMVGSRSSSPAPMEVRPEPAPTFSTR
jgi:uncharacterized membrane protein